MLELLAQAQGQNSGLLNLVEKLARTPISDVLIFSLICSALRVGLHYYLLRLDPIKLPTPGPRILRFFHDLFDALIYAGILVFLLIRPFAVQTFRIPSESMVPTLQVGDLIIVNKAIYRYSEPKAGDIVVFKPPAFARRPEDDPNIDFVKRMIGTPGQLVEIKGRQLFRDGVAINEPYLNVPLSSGPTDFKLIEYPKGSGQIIPVMRDANGNVPGGRSLQLELVRPDEINLVWNYPAQKLPPGKYLMLGDNRDGSYDGRFWGLIERRQIVGKAWFTFWPISRFGSADKRK